MEQKNPFDSRTLIALAVCLAMWFGYQKYLETKYPDMMKQTAQQASNTNKPEAAIASKDGNSPLLPLGKETDAFRMKKSQVTETEKTWVFENDLWKVLVSNHGGKIREVELKRYSSRKSKAELILIGHEDKGLLNISTDGKTARDFGQVNFHMESPTADKLILTGELGGQSLRKTLTFLPDKYTVNVKVEISGQGAPLKTIIVENGLEVPKQEESSATSFLSFGPAANSNYQEFFFYHKNKKERDVITYKETPAKTIDQVQLAALGSRYFTTLFINKSNVLPTALTSKVDGNSILKISYPVLDESDSQRLDFDMYMGPKSLSLLESVDPSLNVVVDYGMFSIIAVPLLGVMKWFYGMVGNYGLAIILLTLLVRSLTFPFTYLSYKSMKAMQTIQPKVAALKEQYKGNTQAFNVEVMKLYKENKVNPMGGCLPMLLQLPIFWALYQVLQNSIELYKAPFFGWILDLSQKDPYYVLPVLMGISMFAQQKLTPSTMDPAQAKMMAFMPIFFSFLMFGLPSGLTLYIFVSTVFGIIQQLFIMKDKKPRATQALTTS